MEITTFLILALAYGALNVACYIYGYRQGRDQQISKTAHWMGLYSQLKHDKRKIAG